MLTWVSPGPSCVSRSKTLARSGCSAGVCQYMDADTSLKQIREQEPRGGQWPLRNGSVRKASEAVREVGLGGSRVPTSGSHRTCQKGGVGHSCEVLYPTLLLTELPARKLRGPQDPRLDS